MSSATNRDVAEEAAEGPVAATGLAKVARLRVIVIIVIAKFGVERMASRAFECIRFGLNVLESICANSAYTKLCVWIQYSFIRTQIRV